MPTGVLIAIFIIVGVGTLAIGLNLYRCAATTPSSEQPTDESGKAVGSSQKKTKPSLADIKRWYRAALDKIVAARLEQESGTESGEPVYLSHHISHGIFRHWVLHAYGYKYELREDPDRQGVYDARIGSSEFNLDAYKQSVLTTYSPEIGKYFYSMVGWTTLSKEQIDAECRRVSETFGTYTLLLNNCHDFLQQLADKIVTTRAPDWDWFRRNTISSYHYMNATALNYEVISAATWIRHLERRKHYLSETERQQVDEFIAMLRGRVEANIARSSNSTSLGMADGAGADGSDHGGHYDSGHHHGGHHHGGHHHGGHHHGGHDHAGGHGAGGHGGC
ncbi:hypothetical protein AbraIFM66950_007195 [Aspergillus brasiliensis]|nr:hypothetical protein AbraIFM66950_007195 [Aspergillus brasiliensis]